MSKDLLVSHCYYQSKTMVASTAAVTFPGPGGLISGRARPRSRPAGVKLQQQRPSSINIHIISRISSQSKSLRPLKAASGGGVPLPPLDLTEENIELVLADARVELAQLFDTEVGITGQVELSELDGPFVKISLKGRFWHKRTTVVARVGNYLKQRIPEILEVEIEDEKQLDDSPENF
ncbi:hypothetical protein ERO13_A10G120700v2 [Gossypium hirsutum]|uniref:NifU-like protein 2, chloroplastic n=5 Tax=Gossypium TaxID=3633 RepID=A0A1U8KB07_GOSHI|nr:uncharacterized protein LOC107915070 [Gossypium hirsutum]XP_017621138.1 uncharacterized protein LOC108465326 isoform X1 [Gossypium arboreum]KAB2062100.1 hypothetical protein ES319_A10G130100v1 [Gossypium barbadense]TYG98780.1 hypothetical protein ES288_A10G143800v1 [Gossypium darwinii]TYI06203.1 hypothetical protein ES332_A10G141500v1 [Gossypium tomentosum]TYJ14697.1 hypothetical protein E1A91_A10G134200v1 [Gossypium mustelinum]KAG4179698.1 hypothetical protein ERO13_A10G120700v2 [Gossypiu